MGIQGLLQALKPHVERVHVSKYSGQRVGIDAYSWLHKGAFGLSWQELREVDTRPSSDKLPAYVTYCMHRIKMLQYNKITPVVVFDGGRLPLKALTEQNRRRTREENLQKAEQKLAEGEFLSAQEYFQKAVEITPSMAHKLIKILRDERVEYVVAPYEADAQLAHLSTYAPEEGGVSTIITEDSDLLAYGCKVVLFKMDKFGNGEELCLDRIMQPCTSPAMGMSFRNFTEDLFLAMCVLAGCDFLASIPGIGVKTAHALLAKYRNVHRVLNKLRFSKPAQFPEGYITNFWQAKAIFKHARVYEQKTRSLKLLNPLPDELLKEFGGETDFLGPDLPQSRARAIAIGQLDPTTMCSFEVLPNRTPFTVSKHSHVGFFRTLKMGPSQPSVTNAYEALVLPNRIPTPFPTLKSPEMEFMEAQKRELFRTPQRNFVSVFGGLEGSLGSGTSLQTVPAPFTEMRTETSQTVISSTSSEVDQQILADVEPIALSGSDQLRPSEVTALSQMSGQGDHEPVLVQDVPNNNPYGSQKVGQSLAHLVAFTSSHAKLEPNKDKSLLSTGKPLSSFVCSMQDSQQLSSSGEELTRELTSHRGISSSPMSTDPEVATCCSIGDQSQSKESSGRVRKLHCSNFDASQSSSNSCGVSVLTDISPNSVTVAPSSMLYPIAYTPSSAPALKTKDPHFGSGGKMGLPKSNSRLKKSKIPNSAERRNSGGKRSKGSVEGYDGSILRFFKPVECPQKRTLDF